MATLKSFQAAGVDGCKAGWCVAVVRGVDKDDAESILELERFFVAGTFAEVLSKASDCKLVCVDIPIGLSDGQKLRRCDVAARKLLRRPRAGSIFPPPIRPCLATNEYKTANATARKFSGKGLRMEILYPAAN